MSRFNQNKPTTATVNRAGGTAFAQSDKLALASLLLTSFLQDQYYRSGNQSIQELIDLTKKVDPIFAAKAAIFARQKFGMRSTSHVVAGELAPIIAGQPWGKSFFEKVIFRPDDILEILSYVNRKPTHAMRKGFKSALEKFDAYQIAKYKADSKSLKLVDAVNIVHAHTDVISQLTKGELEAPETFETKLSAAGKSANKSEAKAEAWKQLLETRKIGYTALLRNLRNIAEQAPELIPTACELLTDEALIRKSKVFPFQYLTAYNEVTDRQLRTAISRAIDISCSNVPKFEGVSLIAVDNSGSMGGKPIEIASLFAAIMYKAMNSRVLVFADYSKEYIGNPDDSVMTIAQGIRNVNAGGGTAFSSIFNGIKGYKFDRIFILSDMQSWQETYWGDSVKQMYNDYVKADSPECKLYSFDLQGYGDMQFPQRNVFCVAGWSEKAFDVIEQLESGVSLVEQIEAVEL